MPIRQSYFQRTSLTDTHTRWGINSPANSQSPLKRTDKKYSDLNPRRVQTEAQNQSPLKNTVEKYSVHFSGLSLLAWDLNPRRVQTEVQNPFRQSYFQRTSLTNTHTRWGINSPANSQSPLNRTDKKYSVHFSGLSLLAWDLNPRRAQTELQNQSPLKKIVEKYSVH